MTTDKENAKEFIWMRLGEQIKEYNNYTDCEQARERYFDSRAPKNEVEWLREIIKTSTLLLGSETQEKALDVFDKITDKKGNF